MCYGTHLYQRQEGTKITGPSKSTCVVDQKLRIMQRRNHVGPCKKKERVLERLFYSVVEVVHGELCACFGELPRTEADRENFMYIVEAIPLLEPTGAKLVESDYIVGGLFLAHQV